MRKKNFEILKKKKVYVWSLENVLKSFQIKKILFFILNKINY